VAVVPAQSKRCLDFLLEVGDQFLVDDDEGLLGADGVVQQVNFGRDAIEQLGRTAGPWPSLGFHVNFLTL